MRHINLRYLFGNPLIARLTDPWSSWGRGVVTIAAIIAITVTLGACQGYNDAKTEVNPLPGATGTPGLPAPAPVIIPTVTITNNGQPDPNGPPSDLCNGGIWPMDWTKQGIALVVQFFAAGLYNVGYGLLTYVTHSDANSPVDMPPVDQAFAVIDVIALPILVLGLFWNGFKIAASGLTGFDYQQSVRAVGKSLLGIVLITPIGWVDSSGAATEPILAYAASFPVFIADSLFNGIIAAPIGAMNQLSGLINGEKCYFYAMPVVYVGIGIIGVMLLLLSVALFIKSAIVFLYYVTMPLMVALWPFDELSTYQNQILMGYSISVTSVIPVGIVLLVAGNFIVGTVSGDVMTDIVYMLYIIAFIYAGIKILTTMLGGGVARVVSVVKTTAGIATAPARQAASTGRASAGQAAVVMAAPAGGAAGGALGQGRYAQGARAGAGIAQAQQAQGTRNAPPAAPRNAAPQATPPATPLAAPRPGNPPPTPHPAAPPAAQRNAPAASPPATQPAPPAAAPPPPFATPPITPPTAGPAQVPPASPPTPTPPPASGSGATTLYSSGDISIGSAVVNASGATSLGSATGVGHNASLPHHNTQPLHEQGADRSNATPVMAAEQPAIPLAPPADPPPWVLPPYLAAPNYPQRSSAAPAPTSADSANSATRDYDESAPPMPQMRLPVMDGPGIWLPPTSWDNITYQAAPYPEPPPPPPLAPYTEPPPPPPLAPYTEPPPPPPLAPRSAAADLPSWMSLTDTQIQSFSAAQVSGWPPANNQPLPPTYLPPALASGNSSPSQTAGAPTNNQSYVTVLHNGMTPPPTNDGNASTVASNPSAAAYRPAVNASPASTQPLPTAPTVNQQRND